MLAISAEVDMNGNISIGAIGSDAYDKIIGNGQSTSVVDLTISWDWLQLAATKSWSVRHD